MAIGYDPDRPLVFLHQPKTAGRTLNEMLKAHFGDEMFPYKRWGDIVEHSDELDRYRFLRGHVYYDVVDFFRREPQVMTVLRDPVDRLVSSYNYIRRRGEHARNERVTNQTLEEFASHPPNVRTYVRFLAYAPRDGDYTDMKPDLPFDALVERACRRLDGMFVVALTESFDSMYRDMADAIGVPVPDDIPRFHEAPKEQRKREVPDRVREIVHELGAADVAIYEYARKLVGADG
jgi:hypothetical protein